MIVTNSTQQLYVLLAHTIVAVVIIVGAIVLAALHDIDGQALTAIFGAGIGLVGGSVGSLAIVGFTSNGKTNGNGNGQQTPPTQSGQE